MSIHPAIMWSIGAMFAGAVAAVAVDFAGVRTALRDGVASERAQEAPDTAAQPSMASQPVTESDADVQPRLSAEASRNDNEDRSLPGRSADETQTALAIDPEEPSNLTDGGLDVLVPPDDAAAPDLPRFDLLRAEPDGSLVIAGSGPADATMEIVAGARTIATAQSAANGDFVAILDEPLDPGDYQIVLRATAPDGIVVTSLETAVVAIPEAGSSDVLALVEAPGAPSRLITTPGPGTPVLAPVPETDGEITADASDSVADAPDDQTASAETDASTVAALGQADGGLADATTGNTGSEQAGVSDATSDAATMTAGDDRGIDAGADANTTELAALPDAAVEPGETPEPAAPDEISELRIEAVEIDGADLFVAGAATPGTRLRLYANAILLGDAIASEGGRFLVQVRRELPVGDYIIRADAIDVSSGRVLRRASVPFTRSAGERLAAVAVAPSVRLPQSPPSIPFDELAPPPTDEQSGGTADLPDQPSDPVSAPSGAGDTASNAPGSGETSAGLAVASSTDQPASATPTPSDPVPVPQALGVLQGPPPIAPAVPETTAELVPTGESVIIRRGDTLWQISRRVYGQGVKYTTIYLANQRQISDPDRIWPGQIFDVPDEAMEDAETVHRELRERN